MKTIKTVALTTVGIFATLALIGSCAGPADSPAAPTTEPEAPTAEITADQKYLDLVHSASPESNILDDTQLLGLGYNACTVYDEGYSSAQIAEYLITTGSVGDNGADPEFVGVVLGSAQTYLCPEHLGK